MQDIFGQDTSLTDAAALRDWNAVQMGVLAHAATTPTHLAALLATAPGFALGQACKGMFYLLMGRSELIATAREALSAARAHFDTALPRERHYIAALEIWLAGQPSAAIAKLEQVLHNHPQDALAMKLSHSIRFVLGDSAGMRRSIERLLPAYGTDHAGHGYLLGCHAFTLEETGSFEKAEIVGRQALWTAPDDAWGLHAVAHVHEMTGNAQAGLDWLQGREAAWSHCNNFRYHVWWHKALMHLDLGQIDQVFDLYDHEIRSDKTDDYRDISNGTSLLMRLELNGANVGERWEELAELAANRTEDGSLIFADLHYLLALAGHNRKEATSRLVKRIHADAQTRTDEAGQRMANPGCAAALGLEAFGEGDYAGAFANLSQARGSMWMAGGSNAQRDVFERITIDSGLRAGQLDAVESILDDRQAYCGGNEGNYALARREVIAEMRGSAAPHSLSAQ
ncbi:tetratricopeptide repeat protein [Parasedimentitalea psychrophila]|uniref:Tetratricopeptide repeat protein 38 n=1 Tax=Parasedimentitalea psychrophila TaxID=2997337 RepID=A0A9Y2L0H7_9RHOB|nr:tetratricopeptide repeat protein [Parasedimentitalea psychrophila]WIY25302.1 tetratricopeptide repeat protein [Parasedimentitalea psychrophila]